MAFSEELKLAIKKKAHFACCLCHTLGVEIHHVVPQAEGGPDTEDNAAPLCPTCHEMYGANPQKRKFIREARDFWYELCAIRYSGDSALLNEIAEHIEQTASKRDLEDAVEKLTRLLTKEVGFKEEGLKELVSVELPIKYWLVVLAALEPAAQNAVSHIKEIRASGYSYDDIKKLPEEWAAALAGALISRGTIVDILVEKGVMKAEAAAAIGAKMLLEQARKFEEEQNSHTDLK